MVKTMMLDELIEYYKTTRPKGIEAMIADCDRLEDKKYYQGRLAMVEELVKDLERNRAAIIEGMRGVLRFKDVAPPEFTLRSYQLIDIDGNPVTVAMYAGIPIAYTSDTREGCIRFAESLDMTAKFVEDDNVT